MKLHLGCGKNIKDGYINIDKFYKDERVLNYDISNLPYENNSVDEILTEHVIEHIPFKDEKMFWDECFRVLKPGGILQTECPDMEWLCKQFLKSKDDFKEFYKVGSPDHYFGNGKSINHRWGMITTHFFGNQNGDGQFHYNGYTEGKLLAISKLIGFSDVNIMKICNKGAHCLVSYFKK